MPAHVTRARTSPPPLRALNRSDATAAGPRSTCSASNPEFGVHERSDASPASHAAMIVPPVVVKARTTALVADDGCGGAVPGAAVEPEVSSASTFDSLYGASDVPKMPCRIDPTAPVATAVATATVTSHAAPASTHRRTIVVDMHTTIHRRPLRDG